MSKPIGGRHSQNDSFIRDPGGYLAPLRVPEFITIGAHVKLMVKTDFISIEEVSLSPRMSQPAIGNNRRRSTIRPR
jgi:hypothetical protein